MVECNICSLHCLKNNLKFILLHPLQTLRPLEDKFLFSQFQAPPLDDADFSAKPMIMVIGQYSVGELASQKKNT